MSRSSILTVSCRRFSIRSHSSVIIFRLISGFFSNLDKILVLISPSFGSVCPCTNISGLRSFNLNLLHFQLAIPAKVERSSKLFLSGLSTVILCWVKNFSSWIFFRIKTVSSNDISSGFLGSRLSAYFSHWLWQNFPSKRRILFSFGHVAQYFWKTSSERCKYAAKVTSSWGLYLLVNPRLNLLTSREKKNLHCLCFFSTLIVRTIHFVFS